MKVAGWLWLAAVSLPVQALEWSSNQVEVLRGNEFHEPFNPQRVGKTTLTYLHADGHAYGRNLLFVDYLQSNAADSNAREIYGEGYTSLSLSKLSGEQVGGGAIRDLNLTFGVNYGEKNYPAYRVTPRVFLPGVTVDFSAPGFNFLTLDMLAYVDRGLFAGRDNGCHATGWQVTPAWELPFKAGEARLTFEGFVDVIGQHGACARQILSQPRLRWDVGHHWGAPDHLYLGLEYQYWQNKFGLAGEYDRVAQTFLMWKF